LPPVIAAQATLWLAGDRAARPWDARAGRWAAHDPRRSVE
jgi:hypothetical protein